jgi:hypothetical protein
MTEVPSLLEPVPDPAAMLTAIAAPCSRATTRTRRTA